MSHTHDRPHPLRSLAVLAIGALGFALAQTTLIPTPVSYTHLTLPTTSRV